MYISNGAVQNVLWHLHRSCYSLSPQEKFQLCSRNHNYQAKLHRAAAALTQCQQGWRGTEFRLDKKRKIWSNNKKNTQITTVQSPPDLFTCNKHHENDPVSVETHGQVSEISYCHTISLLCFWISKTDLVKPIPDIK